MLRVLADLSGVRVMALDGSRRRLQDCFSRVGQEIAWTWTCSYEHKDPVLHFHTNGDSGDLEARFALVL